MGWIYGMTSGQNRLDAVELEFPVGSVRWGFGISPCKDYPNGISYRVCDFRLKGSLLTVLIEAVENPLHKEIVGYLTDFTNESGYKELGLKDLSIADCYAQSFPMFATWAKEIIQQRTESFASETLRNRHKDIVRYLLEGKNRADEWKHAARREKDTVKIFFSNVQKLKDDGEKILLYMNWDRENENAYEYVGFHNKCGSQILIKNKGVLYKAKAQDIKMEVYKEGQTGKMDFVVNE